MVINNQWYKGVSPGTAEGLSLKESLYIGGYNNFKNISYSAMYREGFTGQFKLPCVQIDTTFG